MTQNAHAQTAGDLDREYAEILGRREKPRAGDRKRLEALLPVLGKDQDDVELDALIIAEARRLAGEAEGLGAVQSQIKDGEKRLQEVRQARDGATARREALILEDQEEELCGAIRELEAQSSNKLQSSLDLLSLRSNHPGLLEPLIGERPEWQGRPMPAGDTAAICNAKRELAERRSLAAMSPERRAAQQSFYAW